MTRRLIWLTLFAAVSLLAQQYPFTLVPNSPPHIGSMLQDHLGRLWMIADGDVRCFDGQRFFSLRQFGMPRPNGAAFGALAEDSEGGIWLCSPIALWRFEEGRLELVRKGYAGNVASLAPGVVLAGMGPTDQAQPTLLNLFRFRKTRGHWNAEQLSDWEMNGSGTLRVSHQGSVLFPCPGGWCELPRQTIVDWHPGSPGRPIHHPDPYADSRSVLRDRLGCLWFRSLSGAMYQCPGDAKPTQLPLEVASNGLAINEAPDGSIVLASSFSWAIGRPGAFHVATGQNGLPLGSPFAAQDGTIWLAGGVGRQDGLYRFSYPFQLEFWTEREGLNAPFSILRTGNKIFAGSGLGISVLSQDRSRWLPLNPTHGLGVIRNLLPGPGTTMFAVPHHNGVVQLAGDGSVIARSAAAADPQAMQLARSADGKLWLAGTGVSQVRHSGRQLNLIPESLDPPRSLGTDIEFEPHTGGLWACYAGGLITKEGDSWRKITTRDGLLENSCRTLSALPNGDVWVGYFTAGPLALVHRNASNQFTVRNYYTGANNGVALRYFLDLDRRGWIWRGDDPGIYLSDVTSAAAGQWIPLNSFDGLPALSANQQSFYADRDGSVWWGAVHTITHFSPPADFVHPGSAPAAFISAYSLNGGAPKLAESVHAIPHGAELVAHIGSLQFDRRNALQVRYRLDGQNWRQSRSLDLPLGTLAWGSHTLEVQARLFTGPWSGSAVRSFTVLKPIWLAWPLLLGFAIGSLATAALFYHWRKRRLRRARGAFPDLAEWRLAALSPEAHEVVGTVLDSRYAVGNLLARGGFATVFHGRDLQAASRPCAVKIFRQELDKTWIANRLRQEISALERICHPNIVRIYGHGQTPSGAHYLIMEFVEGQTLRSLLPPAGFPPARVASLLKQASQALAQLHLRDICHRDLKPENLMIRSEALPNHDLVLIDFSIALVKEPDETIHGLSRAAGTIYYMAPEQAIGYANSSSDIYSLAKVVIELLTGRRLSMLLPDASIDLPLRVRELLLRLPVSFSPASLHLLSSALEFDPARRPQSVTAFADPLVSDLESARVKA